MVSDLYDFVMKQPLFSTHDHHYPYQEFEKGRLDYAASAFLGYADADIDTIADTKPGEALTARDRVAAYWPYVRTTGYGQAVNLACIALFGMEFSEGSFDEITEKLQVTLKSKSAEEVYEYFVGEKAAIRWVIQDGLYAPGNEELLKTDQYPDAYRFAWRMDELFSITDTGPIELMERATGISINTLSQLVEGMNDNIDRFKSTGKLAAFKLGIAYERDLNIEYPTAYQAESSFDRIRDSSPNREQRTNGTESREGRPLADYLIHQLLQRASDEDIPVQIHTGFLTGSWSSLAGTKALHLLPVFERYRQVRFDVFHASWPWTSELCAIAKSYPNVYPDLCWMWALNSTGAERTLAEWLDGIPFNKIFAFGADTDYPWCSVGYALQARLGIARVLEEKVRKGFFSKETAREVASAIMLENGERFHGLCSGENIDRNQ